MADVLIRTSAGRDKVDALLRDVPGYLSGRLPDRYGLARACMSKLIQAALKDVWEEFDRKSKGGAGEDGTVWEPLHPYTIRERSKGRGVSGRPAGKSLGKEDYRWLRQTKRDIYYRELRRLLAGGVPLKEAQRQAAIVSRFLSKGVWQARNKALGLKGREGVPAGPEDFPILDDTGRLKKSAEPGGVGGAGLTAEYHESPGQTVTYGRGFVRADSTVPYGDPHMRPGRGSKTGGFRPARPWKFPGEVPDAWVERWARALADAIVECLPAVIGML